LQRLKRQWSDEVVKSKVKQILEGMIEGKINIINGCQDLSNFEVMEEHEFFGYDFTEHLSNFHHIPLPEEYHLWNNSALEEKLKELETYKQKVLTSVKDLLKEISDE
jgi:hypothetical protein